MIIIYKERLFWSEYEILNGTEGNEQNLGNFGNTIWVVVISMSSVGSGDFVPKTRPGRLICALAALWGGVIITYMVVIMAKLLSLNEVQTKGFYVLSLSQDAARLIIKFLLYSHIKRNTLSTLRDAKQAYQELEFALQRFKASRYNILHSGITVTTSEEEVIKTIKRDLHKVKQAIKHFKEYAISHDLFPSKNI